jgi:hypothetical protein
MLPTLVFPRLTTEHRNNSAERPAARGRQPPRLNAAVLLTTLIT